MNPYYDKDGITIYCGDARQVVPHVPPCDLLLTDPPYGIGVCKRGTVGSQPTPTSKRSGWKGIRCTEYGKVEWDFEVPPRWVLEAAMEKSRLQIVWGGGYLGYLPRATFWLVWDKRNDGMSFSQAEIAWTNYRRKSVRMFRWRWNGLLQEDMRHKEKRVHPTQKPVSLMEWALGFAPRAQLVLDPFMGSGTTLVAARRRGMRAIGIEREKKYCQVAIDRLQKTKEESIAFSA